MAVFSVEHRHRASEAKPKKDDHTKALKFATLLDKELKDFLKAVVLFGSCTTHPESGHADIDVLVVIDDVERVVTPEVTEAYRLIVQKCSLKTSPLLHVNTLKLSTFWEYTRSGEPVLINMLRDGVVLIDKGFFAPTQLLLDQGRIRPTREAIYTYYARTGSTLHSAQQHLLSATTDLYWAAIDASHAALMAVGEMPPSPEHVADMLQNTLVKKKLLDPKHVPVMRELYHLQKSITHRDIKEISGEQYQVYYRETIALVDALRTVVETKNP